jgi:signal recognition particle receptor subunit beta
MVQFNFAERTIKAKVVYYGPAQSGKTTNLEQIHRLTDPEGQNRLVSLNTAQDRTLFFDLLPFSLGTVGGYDFKVQIYTVPGQVQYNATRRVVLAGADAVVFVADSGRGLLKENQAAFENMKVNLLANRLVPEKTPLVFQFNKQDLPDPLTPAELEQALNPWGRPSFPAVATRGDGVMDSFVAIVREMLVSISLKYNLKDKGLDPAEVPAVVEKAFAPFRRPGGEAPSAPPPEGLERPVARVVIAQTAETAPPAPVGAPAGEGGLVSDELLHRAIRSSVELAEALADLVRDMNLGLGSIQANAELLLLHEGGAWERRRVTTEHILQEATRLRQLIQEAGRARTPVAKAPPLPPAPRPHDSMSRTVLAELQPSAAAMGPPPGEDAASPLADLLARVAIEVRRAAEARQIILQTRLVPGTSPPTCPLPEAEKALGAVLEGILATAPVRTTLAVRAERKPVIVRSKGGENRRSFLMFGVAQAGTVEAEDQARLQRGDPRHWGGAGKLVRDLGGFVRFNPLPGGLETRLFLPAD